MGGPVSIWHSMPEEVPAIDLHNPLTDRYAGTGIKDVNVDVATSGHHDKIRLSCYTEGTTPALDTELMLSRDAADALIRNLMRALGPGAGRTLPQSDVGD